METRANYFIVGVFVLGVLGLLLGFIYWTKNDASGSSGRNYAVIFDGSVQGLAKSSPVLFNGIRFGAVRTIELMPEDTRKVRVLITIRDETPVRANSHARISHQGLAGLVAMEITPGTPDAAMLQVKQGEQYPVIYADPGSGSFLTGMSDAASQANALAARLNNLVANNEDSIRHTITNLKSFSTMMADRKDDVAGIVQDVRGLSARLKRDLAKGGLRGRPAGGSSVRSPGFRCVAGATSGEFFSTAVRKTRQIPWRQVRRADPANGALASRIRAFYEGRQTLSG